MLAIFISKQIFQQALKAASFGKEFKYPHNHAIYIIISPAKPWVTIILGLVACKIIRFHSSLFQMNDCCILLYYSGLKDQLSMP